MLKKIIQIKSIKVFCIVILVILMTSISSASLFAHASVERIRVNTIKGTRGSIGYSENQVHQKNLKSGDFIENLTIGAVKITGDLKVRLDKYDGDKPIGECDTVSSISQRFYLSQCFGYDLIPKSDSVKYRKIMNDKRLPYIISPRYTAITTQTPRLKWNHTGSLEYIMSIYDQSSNELKLIFSDKFNEKQFHVESFGTTEGNVSIASIPYPDLNKPLAYDKDYLFSIKSYPSPQKGENDVIDMGDRNIYPAEERQGLVSGLSFKVRKIDMTIEADPLDNVELLLQKSLYANAIDILETLVSGDLRPLSEKTRLYSRLGDLYAESGLNDLANQVYLEAQKHLMYVEGNDIRSDNEKAINYALCNLNYIRNPPQDKKKERACQR
jgi:hypothetical protein